MDDLGKFGCGERQGLERVAAPGELRLWLYVSGPGTIRTGGYAVARECTPSP